MRTQVRREAKEEAAELYRVARAECVWGWAATQHAASSERGLAMYGAAHLARVQEAVITQLAHLAVMEDSV